MASGHGPAARAFLRPGQTGHETARRSRPVRAPDVTGSCLKHMAIAPGRLVAQCTGHRCEHLRRAEYPAGAAITAVRWLSRAVARPAAFLPGCQPRVLAAALASAVDVRYEPAIVMHRRNGEPDEQR
jgi:hypothetical protein